MVPKSNLRQERAAVKQSDDVIGRGSELVTTPRGYAIANYIIQTGDRRSIIEVKPMPNFDQVIMKSRRASSIARLSDGKDYMEEDLDQVDRRPSARRRKDMLASNQEWPGIQALDDELSDEDFEDGGDESHEMLVSGRPARVRFPGSRGDSELRPPQWSEYVEDEDDPDNELSGQDRIRERNLRNTLGGDRLARRAGRRDRGVADEYAAGKSRRLNYDLVKSLLQDGMCAGDIDPAVVLNFAGSVESRIGSDGRSAMQALATIPVAVRRRYGLPTNLGEFESYGEVAREYAA
ncbi:MAG TPA: hypothetical protein VNF29_14965 [Candidatus Binataceae bacterium]|nr:hypothetical protein [Candidatus Binataceae bacterium]